MKYRIIFWEWGICPTVKRNLVYKRKLYSYGWFRATKSCTGLCKGYRLYVLHHDGHCK